MVAMVTDSITIADGQVVVLAQQSRLIIHALDGILWITQGGKAADMLLHAGEQIALTAGGMIAVQTLQGPATFRVTPTQRSLGARLRAWLERMAGEARKDPVAATVTVATPHAPQGSRA